MDKVSKILHQIWVQGWNEMPFAYKQNAETWKNYNPDWEYRFWDDAKIRKLIVEYAPQCLRRYDSYSRPVLKADMGRIMVLKVHGGVYLDTDTQCCGPLRHSVHFPRSNTVYFTQALIPVYFTPLRHALSVFPSNYCIGGPPQHPFYDTFLRIMCSDTSDGGLVEKTGPTMLKRLQHHFPSLGVAEMPKDMFVLSCVPKQNGLTCGTHKYDNTWLPKILKPFTRIRQYVPADLTIVAIAIAIFFFMKYRRSGRRVKRA